MSALWSNARVVVHVGQGGVGKTTSAAALGLAAAASGKRVLVMTIDPAQRLAEALNLKLDGNVKYEIQSPHIKDGSLTALIPDVRKTFDQLVRDYASDKTNEESILNNTIYKHFTSALAGSHEYAAVEQLYQAYAAQEYDLIVLDTPPAQNVVSFLEAPDKVLGFLDNPSVQMLLRQSGRLMDLAGPIAQKMLGKLAGASTVQELLDFLIVFQSMYTPFRSHARGVRELLHSQDVRFVLVTLPTQSHTRALVDFHRELKLAGISPSAVVFNRRRHSPFEHETLAQTKEQIRSVSSDEAVIEELVGALEEEDAEAKAQGDAMGTLMQSISLERRVELPALRGDVTSVDGLWQLAQPLLG